MRSQTSAYLLCDAAVRTSKSLLVLSRTGMAAGSQLSVAQKLGNVERRLLLVPSNG